MARFTLPRDLYYGKDSLETLKTLKGKRAIIVVGGGSMGGSSGGASDDSTGVIVWVKSKEAPANAILEPDPTWDCPEGFWAVPVEVGLSDNSKVEITRGLAEGQEVFIGYQNPDEMYY